MVRERWWAWSGPLCGSSWLHSGEHAGTSPVCFCNLWPPVSWSRHGAPQRVCSSLRYSKIPRDTVELQTSERWEPVDLVWCTQYVPGHGMLVKNGHQGYRVCCYGRAPEKKVKYRVKITQQQHRYVLTSNRPQWKVRILWWRFLLEWYGCASVQCCTAANALMCHS